jgi:hypothetical protein
MKVRRKLVVAALAMTMLIAGTTTATAKPLFNDFDEGSWIEVFDCDGLELVSEGTFREHFLAVGRGRHGLPHFQANVRFTNVITNPATGKTFTIDGSFLDKDHTVTENEDGTYTVIISFHGRERFLGPDGKLLFLNAGQLTLETLWAGDGDFPSDGTHLDVQELGRPVEPTGRWSTEVSDRTTPTTSPARRGRRESLRKVLLVLP